MWFRLRYSRCKSSQTKKTLTLIEIPESTADFGLPSNPTPTGANRADDYDDKSLGLVRFLGLAESQSVKLRRGDRKELLRVFFKKVKVVKLSTGVRELEHFRAAKGIVKFLNA